MADHTHEERVLALVAAAEKPMTVAEISTALDLGLTGTYTLVYNLANAGKLRKRRRPSQGRGRALAEYYVGAAPADTVNLEDYKDEVPDHVWWEVQKAHGFKRPKRAPKQFNIDAV